MTADHRFVLLVNIKNVRLVTNAPNRKAAAAMTEASFQCSRGGGTALATRLNWRSLVTSAANSSLVSFAKQGDRRFVGNDAAVGRQYAVINDDVDVVLHKHLRVLLLKRCFAACLGHG